MYVCMYVYTNVNSSRLLLYDATYVLVNSIYVNIKP